MQVEQASGYQFMQGFQAKEDVLSVLGVSIWQMKVGLTFKNQAPSSLLPHIPRGAF